jgi:hypothetical protein
LKKKTILLISNDEIDRIEIQSDQQALGSISGLTEEEKRNTIDKRLDDLFANHNESQPHLAIITNEAATVARRDRLVQWLDKHRLPVRVEEGKEEASTNDAAAAASPRSFHRINILDSVYIHSPYTINDCQSTNEIILDKVKSLVKSMPLKDDDG